MTQSPIKIQCELRTLKFNLLTHRLNILMNVRNAAKQLF